MVYFFQIFQSEDFAATFGDVPIPKKAVLEWIRWLPSAPYAELVQLLFSNAARGKKDLKRCMLRFSADSVLQELRVKQICQGKPVSLVFYLDTTKDHQFSGFS